MKANNPRWQIRLGAEHGRRHTHAQIEQQGLRLLGSIARGGQFGALAQYWTYLSMRGKDSEEGDSYGGAIFKVFGFPKPNKIDLMGDSSLSDGTNGGWYAAWRGDKLLKKLGA